MKDFAKHFTLYDLLGYFAVGLITCLGGYLAYRWPDFEGGLGDIQSYIRGLDFYSAGMWAIVGYTVGQVLGTLSSFFFSKVLGCVSCFLHAVCGWRLWHDFPIRALPVASERELLKAKILDQFGGNLTIRDDSAQSVFWLCVAYSRELAPATYGDAFKWLVYSGAARSLSLVSLALTIVVLCRDAELKWVFFGVLAALTTILYRTYYRMLEQYHSEVINSVLLLLNDRLKKTS